VRIPARFALILALAASAAALASADRGHGERAELETIEGAITAVAEATAEGGLAVVAVDLDTGGERAPVRVLLAPRGVLEEIEFGVEVGDRLRVRLFAGGPEPALAQRVLNLTRDRLVRLRTLRRIPLWNSAGVWQGGDSRRRPGYGPGGPPEDRGRPARGGGGPGAGR
jgi:hypothetical protein